MITASGLSKQYGNKILYKNASFQLNPGEKVGLVGPNGAGKSTLFRLITGEESSDTGSVSRPDRIRIAYFAQDIEDMRGRTVLDEVKTAIGNLPGIQARLSELETKLSDPELTPETMEKVLEEYGELQAQFEQLGGYNIDATISEIICGLGFEVKDLARDTSEFSGGWKMRIALAKILAQNPDVLLMDEPTNHLDLESIVWLEGWLAAFKGTILMTSHDREFMNRLVGKIIEVADKAITTYSGNYDFYERERALRRTQLIAAAARQEEMLAKEEEFIARFAARASHAAQVQSRVKKIEKIDRIEIPEEEKEIAFEWPVPPRGGDEVVKFEGLGKIWPLSNGESKTVFTGATALVKRLDRVAVVGVNGAGKSTLLKIVSGQTEPTAGSLQVGAGISIGYFSQNSMDVLDPKNTILEEVHSSLPTANVGYLRSLLGAFKFSGEDVEKKISVLSGGEKSRVVLATILARPVNLLILDEPTNHLDIKSREVLLEAVKKFPGTVMIVSHDRFFLNEMTTRVFELDKNRLTVYDRTWTEYVQKKSEHATRGS